LRERAYARSKGVTSGNTFAPTSCCLANTLANEKRNPCKSGCSCWSRKPLSVIGGSRVQIPPHPLNESVRRRKAHRFRDAAVSETAPDSPLKSARVRRNPPTRVLTGERLANGRGCIRAISWLFRKATSRARGATAPMRPRAFETTSAASGPPLAVDAAGARRLHLFAAPRRAATTSEQTSTRVRLPLRARRPAARVVQAVGGPSGRRVLIRIPFLMYMALARAGLATAVRGPGETRRLARLHRRLTRC
jgi:hypothetical protein